MPRPLSRSDDSGQIDFLLVPILGTVLMFVRITIFVNLVGAEYEHGQGVGRILNDPTVAGTQ